MELSGFITGLIISAVGGTAFALLAIAISHIVRCIRAGFGPVLDKEDK